MPVMESRMSFSMWSCRSTASFVEIRCRLVGREHMVSHSEMLKVVHEAGMLAVCRSSWVADVGRSRWMMVLRSVMLLVACVVAS